tara:strand:+ start:1774 stop:3165 length:1392 start_codon:yes stop_codon:yes gene_type:complete
MASNLSNFRIEGLHGEYTYDIPIEDNKLVLVSENGMGKTTVLNALYYSLSRQWKKLSKFSFERIALTIDNTEIAFERREIVEHFRFERSRFSSKDDVRRRLPTKYRRIIDEILNDYPLEHIINNDSLILELSKRNGIPVTFLQDILPQLHESKSSDLFYQEFKGRMKILEKFSESQILYLPTYRRIEQDLSVIFPDLETNLDTHRHQRMMRSRERSTYLELVEFGMEDVKNQIHQRLRHLDSNLSYKLKNNLTGNYLKDIIRKEYKQYTIDKFKNIDRNDLNDILNRIDDTILEKEEKFKLRSFVDQVKEQSSLSIDDKIVAHFITSLLEIYEDQKKEEEGVENFVALCNEYMKSKHFVYDRNVPDIKIYLKRNEREIELTNLSSGEKQIVSLFSHLYLSNEKNYFVVIDEPELSLSVIWQSRLLTDIIDSKLCSGLIAVTHSPYIFKNEMKRYTHSLEEFLD